MSIKAVLFDFGGVLAEEGFKAGINETALKNSLEPDFLKKLAFDAVYETGFVSGKIRDDAFWDFLKSKTGITTANKELTETVLSRFTLRSFMIETVKRLKKNGIKTYILSDQTHWLEDLNRRSGFFSLFDQVFNSFKTRMTKKILKHLNSL